MTIKIIPFKKSANLYNALIIICDPGGTQTHDLQNRNLTFYSTELRSQKNAKLIKNTINNKNFYFFLIFVDYFISNYSEEKEVIYFIFRHITMRNIRLPRARCFTRLF